MTQQNNTMTRRQILEKTMKEMPNTFTSYDFAQRAILNGFKKIGKNSGLGEFIELYASNDYKYSKTWTKKQQTTKNIETISIDEKTCIEFLNTKGYKILKPINQFEEV